MTEWCVNLFGCCSDDSLDQDYSGIRRGGTNLLSNIQIKCISCRKVLNSNILVNQQIICYNCNKTFCKDCISKINYVKLNQKINCCNSCKLEINFKNDCYSTHIPLLSEEIELLKIGHILTKPVIMQLSKDLKSLNYKDTNDANQQLKYLVFCDIDNIERSISNSRRFHIFMIESKKKHTFETDSELKRNRFVNSMQAMISLNDNSFKTITTNNFRNTNISGDKHSISLKNKKVNEKLRKKYNL